MPTIRPTLLTDIDHVMALYDHSRQLMRAAGNTTQWVNGYPDRSLILHDIAHGNSYVVEIEGVVAGVFSFIVGVDPTYNTIYDGQWIDDHLVYGTVHRLARASGYHGIGRLCFSWCEQQVPSVRVDTHSDNTLMRSLVASLGYHYCGIIYIADGTPRLAYQKVCRP